MRIRREGIEAECKELGLTLHKFSAGDTRRVDGMGKFRWYFYAGKNIQKFRTLDAVGNAVDDLASGCAYWPDEFKATRRSGML